MAGPGFEKDEVLDEMRDAMTIVERLLHPKTGRIRG